MTDRIKGLRALIYEKFNSEAKMAKHMGWSRQRLNKITTAQKEPTISEAISIAEALGKPAEIILLIFLEHWSPNGRQNVSA